MAKKKIKRKVKYTIQAFILIVLLGVLTIIGKEAYEYYKIDSQKLMPISNEKEYYNTSDFGFVRLKSNKDYNNNGKDDYTDFLEAEKQFAQFNPKYKSDYYAEGYPPVEKEGVAGDLTWYALKNAGYLLKDMMAKDIANDKKNKIYDIYIKDSNIDFRRITNQDVFFQRYAKTLSNDMYQVGEFMPGDIIVFDGNEHIAMISDKYTKDGVPYIISNRYGKQKQKEENLLENTDMEITGHYRFEYTDKIQKLIDSIEVKNE